MVHVLTQFLERPQLQLLHRALRPIEGGSHFANAAPFDEPHLNHLPLRVWQTIDELNRAFAGEPPSGYVAPPHLFINANIDADGGDQNIFDPGNGYKDAYKKIWGK